VIGSKQRRLWSIQQLRKLVELPQPDDSPYKHLTVEEVVNVSVDVLCDIIEGLTTDTCLFCGQEKLNNCKGKMEVGDESSSDLGHPQSP